MSGNAFNLNASIKRVVDAYQAIADEEKAFEDRRAAAQKKIDKLVDDMAVMGTFDEKKTTPEMTAAFLLFRQSMNTQKLKGDYSGELKMARFNQVFIDSFDEYVRKSGMRAIHGALIGFQDAAPRQPRLMPNVPVLEIALDKPEDDYGTWTFTVVPVVMDENFKVRAAEKLDFDLYLSMEFTPRKGLSGQFNVPAIYVKEGDKMQYLSVSSVTRPGEPEKHLHTNGHLYKNGTLMEVIHFDVFALRKKDAAPPEFWQTLDNGGPGKPKL